ncbi:MAG: hypothetical protein ABW321_01095 [Polyangiales bacterium]
MRRRTWMWIGLGLLMAGCPSAREKPPEAACHEAYAKCVLPSGVLGVCDPVTCQDGQAEPCFVCRSQH